VKSASASAKLKEATNQTLAHAAIGVVTDEVVVPVDAVRAVASVQVVSVARVASVVRIVRCVGHVPSRLLELRGGVSCLYYTDPNLVPRDLSILSIPQSLPGSVPWIGFPWCLIRHGAIR
jgi:hypothetical protein